MSSPHGNIGGSEHELLEKTLEHARALGSFNSWVLTEHDNARALGLYRKVGQSGTDVVMFSFELTGDA